MRCVLKNSRLTVSVDTMGAELRSVRSEKDGFEYMWQGDAEHWQGTAYHLFPFIGRLQGGKYRYCGNEYYMPLHGFAYTSRFIVRKTTNTAVCMELTDNETTYSQYPFRFLLSVEYQLKGDTVTVRYTLKNKDEKTLFFGIGWHPGFNLPMNKGLNFEDYRMTFPRTKSITECGFSDSVLDTGARTPISGNVPLRHEDYSRDLRAFVGTGTTAELSANGTRKTVISYKSMPYFGLWTSRDPAPFICAEIMSMLPGREGVVEELESKSDIISLPPRKSWRQTVSVRFIE